MCRPIDSPGISGMWLGALRVYLGSVFLTSLVWETLHLPLYTIWETGTLRSQAFAVVHCALGDAMIALSAPVLALFIAGDGAWPQTRFQDVALLTVLFGVAYTIFSEWLNVDVRGTWAYQLEDFVATPEGRPFTAFRIGPVACVVLHTGEDKPDDHPTFEGRVAFEPLRAEQAEWLREVTVRPGFCDAPYRVVFCHIPLRWTEESSVDYDAGEYDQFSRRSRDAWHDALVAWGAQIVVSGHTHEPAWLPPTADFPYGQLVSGGPDADATADQPAIWLEGAASSSELVLTLRNLAGGVVHDIRLAPVSKR